MSGQVVITYADGHLHLPRRIPRITQISDAMLRELVELTNDACDEVEQLRGDREKEESRLKTEIERLRVELEGLEQIRDLTQNAAATFKAEVERLEKHHQQHHDAEKPPRKPYGTRDSLGR